MDDGPLVMFAIGAFMAVAGVWIAFGWTAALIAIGVSIAIAALQI